MTMRIMVVDASQRTNVGTKQMCAKGNVGLLVDRPAHNEAVRLFVHISLQY